MPDLSDLLEGWDSLHREETLILRTMTIEESIRQWMRLQIAFEWQLQQTATLFEQDRRAALEEFQARLERLVD